MRLQPMHLLLLVLIILLLFGANRLPDLARGVGKSMKILKEETKDLRGTDTTAPPPTGPQDVSGSETPTPPAASPGPDDR